MGIWEIALIGVALSMDAVAVGMTDGMAEPTMSFRKHMIIAFAFGLFQFFMPVLGYYCGTAFSTLVEKIAPWLSFALLAFIGGRAIVEYFLEQREEQGGVKPLNEKKRKLGAGKLLAQAVATSLDALAIGVTLLAAETTQGLPFHVALSSLLIGLITFALSSVAVYVGQKAGNRIADRAEYLGGAILIVIGLKILLEGIL